MSVALTTKPAQYCLQSMSSLESHPIAPSKIIQGTGVYDKVTSSENMAPWRIINVNDFEGKAKPAGTNTGLAPEIFLEYEKPFCGGGTSNCATSVCDVTGTTNENQGYMSVNVDKCVSRGWTLSDAEFDALCETPSERLATELRRAAYQMKREINVDMIETLYANASAYPNAVPSIGATTESVMVTTSEGNVLPAGYAKMRGTYRLGQYLGDLCVAGGESLATYFDIKRFQGASNLYNPVTGQPLEDPMSMATFAYDLEFDSTIQALQGDTDSYGFSWPVGAVGYVEWFENLGYKAKSFEDHIRTTLPIDGMRFDYFVHYDKCDSVWQILLRKNYALPQIPVTEYCNGTGFNYLWKFECGDPTCATFTPVGA